MTEWNFVSLSNVNVNLTESNMFDILVTNLFYGRYDTNYGEDGVIMNSQTYQAPSVQSHSDRNRLKKSGGLFPA